MRLLRHYFVRPMLDDVIVQRFAMVVSWVVILNSVDVTLQNLHYY